MICRGANPLQMNNDGLSIDEILKLLDARKTNDLKDQKGSDIFVRRVTSRFGKEFRIKINVVSCNDDGSGDDYDSLVVVKALELMRFWVPNIGLHCFFRLYLVSSSQKLGLMSQMSDSG